MPNKHFWAGFSIFAIWMAVLFVGIYGADFTTESSDSVTQKIPGHRGSADHPSP